MGSDGQFEIWVDVHIPPVIYRVLFPSKQLHIREPPFIFRPIRPHELKKIKDKICQLIILLKPEKIAHANTCNAQPPQNVRANKEIIQI